MKLKSGRRVVAAILVILLAISMINVPTVKAAGVTSETVTNDAASIDLANTNHRAVYTFLIDPGHDGSDVGAKGTLNGVTYLERDVNLKIATYLKAELEKYPNVRVYMTRTGLNLNVDFSRIGAYAATVNADALISIHNNASDNTDANGALICVPNANYDKQVYKEANGLGQSILNELVKLGLSNKGLFMRLTANGTKYPDGSLSDYYSIVRQGKLNHVPGIIVEHAFITNTSDLSKYLSTDAKLKALAQADARGIINYYGLNKFSQSTGAVTINRGVDYSDVYDFNYYISHNDDVKAAYGNDPVGALIHFTRYGMKEGRQAIATFNVDDYKNNYTDLQKAFGGDLKKYYTHYEQFGLREERKGLGALSEEEKKKQKLPGTTVYNGVDYSAVYEYDYYINKYADLRAVIGYDDQKAIKHFVQYGMKEGRQAKATFDVHSYRNLYADLRVAFGNNLVKYYLHYIKNGRKEGRKATGAPTLQNPLTVFNNVDFSAVYDMNYYYNKYKDLQKAIGYDEYKLLKHFVQYGMKEGRQAKSTFDVVSYRNANQDLRKAFGGNLTAYYTHYIKHGQFEHRVSTGVPKLQNAVTVYNGIDYGAVYDYNYYYEHNTDLQKAFGAYNEEALIKHFATFGIKEWRQAKESYDKNTYQNLREKAKGTAAYYPIMGTASVTKNQMVKYFNANAKYPDYYKSTDAPTIEAFCQIYIEECKAEGVKVEVAFAQMLLETGYLRYGGLVSIEDKNFAGMGATDSAANRNVAKFNTVREGVRAQVQHLKAYASKDPLKNPQVDPRFHLVTRGTGMYVEYLSIPNNPWGKGWASDKDYAVKIKKIMSAIKTY